MNLGTGKTVLSFIKRHASDILFVAGIGSGIAANISMYYQVPVALQKVNKAEEETGRELTTKEKVKLTWKDYALPAGLAALSLGCLIAGRGVDRKRNAAMMAMAGIANDTLRNFKDSAKEVLNEEQLTAVEDRAARKTLESAPKSISEKIEPIIDENGLIGVVNRGFDMLSGRYFHCSREDVESIVNNLNRRMRDDEVITMNDWFDEIGLPHNDAGNYLAWDIDHGYIDVSIHEQIGFDNIPCFVVTHRNIPYREQ